jgi:hypothetical protein
MARGGGRWWGRRGIGGRKIPGILRPLGRAGGAECSNGGDVRDSSRPLAAATLWVDMAYVDHTTFLCSAHLNVTSIFKCCIISSVKGIYIS